MKKRTLTTSVLLAVAIALIVFACGKEEFETPMMLKIHFNTQQSQKLKTGIIEPLSKNQKASNSAKATNSVIENGANYTIYGTGVTGVWGTEPLTAINWQITNPAIGLDTTIIGKEMISFTFQQLGTYTIRAFNPPPYGFEWFMTVSVVSSLDEALIVQPEPVRSEYIDSSNVFRYYWRVNRPVIFDGTETLFRLFGFSGIVYNPFPAFYNQVYFYGTDSIEWYFDIAPNGMIPGRGKTNIGYLDGVSEIWTEIDTSSVWRCQDPTDNNVAEFIYDNGRVYQVGTVFTPLTGIQTGAGDYGRPIPVVLMGTLVFVEIPLYILASPQTNMWRHKLITDTTWTELPITQTDGRIHPVLPAHTTFNQRIVQYGYMDGINFVPDPYMSLSGMYNVAVQGFSFAY